jgi:hypothetical protein
MIDESTKTGQLASNKLAFHKSSTSFDEIESILYGCSGSRFWVYRKHINSMEHKDIKAGKMPFYAWECLTINLFGGREVNLVIKNEACMKALLKLLIYEMKSVDGKKNSGAKIIETLIK